MYIITFNIQSKYSRDHKYYKRQDIARNTDKRIWIDNLRFAGDIAENENNFKIIMITIEETIKREFNMKMIAMQTKIIEIHKNKNKVKGNKIIK